MTLTNQLDTMEPPKELTPTTGEALREVVWQALEQGRLTCGVHDCARLLEIDPFNTMLCVIPELMHGVSDVSEDIKHILIEALCTEYDIRTVKVDDADKLSILVLGRDFAMDNAGASNKTRHVMSNATAYASNGNSMVDCLLIQYPDDIPSEEDEIIAEHHKSCLFSDDLQQCVISLPD